MPLHDSNTREFHEWTGTSLGKALVEKEQEQLEPMLRNLYGPVAVQYGARDLNNYLQLSNAIRRFHSLDRQSSGDTRPLSDRLLYSRPESMPLDTKSVNVLMLPHVLEFSADPHQILRESARVLVPEGHLVLVCFNPASLWGIRNSFGKLVNKQPPAPWCGRFFGLSRVKDWLSVLGFDVVSGSSVCFLPPIKSSSLRAKFVFLEKTGARWWPMWAAVYILVVRKREIGLTPLMPRWKRKRGIATGLAEPATRNG